MAFQRRAAEVVTVLTLVVTLFAVPGLSAPTPPAPAAAIFPGGTDCPEVPRGVPSNSCYNYDGSNHVCCINPDSCGLLDASGGATCQMDQYVLYNQPTTFVLIGKDAPCPVCQGSPSNPCFSSYGDAKVCCVNPDSCKANLPATCTNDDYVTFTGAFTAPTPVGCN